jgi:uncharacterized membrane protein YphA (DoxX/SURF4 family)
VSSPVLVEPPQLESTRPRWNSGARIAFRFAVLYFGLFSVCTQILTSLLPLPGVDIPDPGSLPPLRQIIGFVARHVFHLQVTPAFFAETGSGDRPCDWVFLFCVLVASISGTILWSLLDGRRGDYVALRKWFWLFFRFALAGQMFAYAFAKIVPLQMPFPPLYKLVEPVGNLSPMGMLWTSIGASPAYEIFAGSAEFLGGLLVLIPRTRTLGALVCVADMTQVFLLNMTYDVPVKILSFNLILLSLLLLTPEVRRLANFFFLNRTAEAPVRTLLFRSARKNRIAAAVQALFAVALIGSNVWGARIAWKTYGAGVPKPALYGIWNVDEQTVDGQVRAPLLTDAGRWRRVLIDDYHLMIFLPMNDERVYYSLAIDEKTGTLKLSDRVSNQQKALLTYTRPAPDRLLLDGAMDGHKVHLELSLYDRKKFVLVSRGFHWVSPVPFNK